MNSSVDFMSSIHSLKQELFHKYDPTIAPVHNGGTIESLGSLKDIISGSLEYGFMDSFAMMITYAKLTDVVSKLTNNL